MAEVAMRAAPSRTETFARWAGWLALYIMALSVDLSTTGFSAAAILVVIASIPLAGTIWRDLRGLPAFWLVTALTVYVVVQSQVLASYHPVMHESSNPHWSHVLRVSGLFSLLVGWWLFQYRRDIPWLLVFVALGLFANRLLSIDYPMLLEEPFARRELWGRVPTRVGFASAAGLVICFATLLTQRTLKQGSGLDVWFHRAAISAVVLGFLGFLVVLYGTQSRGAWFGALVACAFLLTVVLARGARTRRSVFPAAAGGTLLALGFAVIVSLGAGEVMEERFGKTSEVFDAIMALDEEALLEADRALGLRVNMWIAALEAMRDRPWFGYGSGSKPVLAQRSDLEFGSSTGHLHNIYVDIAYSLGMVGLLGFVLAYGVLFRGFLRAWRLKYVPDGVALVTAGFWVMALFTLLTDVLIGHASSRALLTFMLAVTCYGVLAMHRSQPHCEPGGMDQGTGPVAQRE